MGTNRLQTSFVSLEDMIAGDNPVRIIDAFVDRCDLRKLGFSNTGYKSEGRPPFHPCIFLKPYLYGYINRIRSSRRLEAECARNIEVRWLIGGLLPNYHSIADFRRVDPAALKNVFRLFVGFLKQQNLIGSDVIAIDGTKQRAVNSRKNNYNQKKIDRHLSYIEERTNQYLGELDELDKQDSQDETLMINKSRIADELKNLLKRKAKYDGLAEQLQQSGEDQISTTDPESRALIINKSMVEVAYNNQTVVDSKHKLIVYVEATNKNDINALSHLAGQAREHLDIPAETTLTALADKAYHNGMELDECEQINVTTLVAFKEQPSVKHIEKEFLVRSFLYDKQSDSYTCPNSETLTTTGTWYFKKREDGKTSYRFKKYTTQGCAECPLKSQCTVLKHRAIERSEYQDAVDKNNERLITHKELYRSRQAIIEHVFGTIKRSWGYRYTLLKGLKKVNGEINPIALVYNLKRTMNIMGVKMLLETIKNWAPDYTKLPFNPKKAPIQGSYRENKPADLQVQIDHSFLQAA